MLLYAVELLLRGMFARFVGFCRFCSWRMYSRDCMFIISLADLIAYRFALSPGRFEGLLGVGWLLLGIIFLLSFL
jgi:hypothetical protein